jgi:hypothetical protein
MSKELTIAGIMDEFSSPNQLMKDLLDEGLQHDQIIIVSETGAQKGIPKPQRTPGGFQAANIRGVGRALVTGSLVGDVGEEIDLGKWLVQAGIAKPEREQYLHALREGQTLVVVQAGEDQAQGIVDLLSGGHGSGGGTDESIARNLIMVSRSKLERGGTDDRALEGGSHGGGGGTDE